MGKIYSGCRLQNSFGFIKFVKITEKTEGNAEYDEDLLFGRSPSDAREGREGEAAASGSEDEIPIKTKERWVPFELRFGLPLFDLPLNLKICQRIEQKQLFQPESIKRHSINMRQLSLELLEFISQQVGSLSEVVQSVQQSLEIANDASGSSASSSSSSSQSATGSGGSSSHSSTSINPASFPLPSSVLLFHKAQLTTLSNDDDDL